MGIQNIIGKFKKIGAQIKEGYLDDSWEAVVNGKSVFFDEFGCWTESGFDEANQETSRRIFSNPTQAIKWAKACQSLALMASANSLMRTTANTLVRQATAV